MTEVAMSSRESYDLSKVPDETVTANGKYVQNEDGENSHGKDGDSKSDEPRKMVGPLEVVGMLYNNICTCSYILSMAQKTQLAG